MTANDWYIKGMPATNQARRKITAYAALKGITIPQALAEIVMLAKI
jgi:hypothetical protein